jgi:antitoxin (DNA-binding transcriptional repressor) of toxin-antitoxin stability system
MGVAGRDSRRPCSAVDGAVLPPRPASLYVVHMKKVTASEARKHWFRILDDAAQGEVIVLERKGRRLVLHREELDKLGSATKGPDYRRLLRAPDADKADRWSWEWRGPHGRLIPRRATRR